MVSNATAPQFTGGVNIAIKVPPHQYDETFAFYRDTLQLTLIEEEPEGAIFQFGPVQLWLDKAPQLSHAETWLELITNDTQSARAFLKNNGVPIRTDLEQMPDDFDGFYIHDPAGIVHLVVSEEA